MTRLIGTAPSRTPSPQSSPELFPQSGDSVQNQCITREHSTGSRVCRHHCIRMLGSSCQQIRNDKKFVIDFGTDDTTILEITCGDHGEHRSGFCTARRACMQTRRPQPVYLCRAYDETIWIPFGIGYQKT
jgi:hypothetical protein